jgi:hypothetical protein
MMGPNLAGKQVNSLIKDWQQREKQSAEPVTDKANTSPKNNVIIKNTESFVPRQSRSQTVRNVTSPHKVNNIKDNANFKELFEKLESTPLRKEASLSPPQGAISPTNYVSKDVHKIPIRSPRTPPQNLPSTDSPKTPSKLSKSNIEDLSSKKIPEPPPLPSKNKPIKQRSYSTVDMIRNNLGSIGGLLEKKLERSESMPVAPSTSPISAPNNNAQLTQCLQTVITHLLNKDSDESALFSKQAWPDMEVKEFSPGIFKQIRDTFVDGKSEEIKKAICDNLLKVINTPGKSGATLMFSQDAERKFVIKTMKWHESKALRDIVKVYYNHLKNNPQTLLPQFYMHFRLHINGIGKNYFMVMNNHFAGHVIRETYDLKGSLVGRKADEKDLLDNIKKDLDVVESKKKFVLGPAVKDKLIRQLDLDASFLNSQQIMDYSLLIGVSASKKDCSRGISRVWNLVDKELYCIGIIDILQTWNFNKKAEMMIKSTYNEVHKVSSIPPQDYAKRFTEFMNENIT